MNPTRINTAMIPLLIRKDWYLHRYEILGAVAVGLIALPITVFTGKAGFVLGVILLVGALVTISMQMAITTVINERKEQTLAFVMSLPVSPREYTTAKILANLLIFLLAWAVILLGALALILLAPGIPHGILPFAVIMIAELLVTGCLIFSVAIMTESQPWTIAALLVGEFAFNLVGYAVAHTHGIAAYMEGAHVYWNAASVAILGTELVLVALLLGLTFFVQGRKTDFL